jgi:hypothetical protein
LLARLSRPLDFYLNRHFNFGLSFRSDLSCFSLSFVPLSTGRSKHLFTTSQSAHHSQQLEASLFSPFTNSAKRASHAPRKLETDGGFELFFRSFFPAAGSPLDACFSSRAPILSSNSAPRPILCAANRDAEKLSIAHGRAKLGTSSLVTSTAAALARSDAVMIGAPL